MKVRKAVVVFAMACSITLPKAGPSALNLKLPFRSGESWIVTTGYGGSPTHKSGTKDGYAIDFNHDGGGTSDLGRPILAVADGTVIKAHCDFDASNPGDGYGCRVKLSHLGDSYRSLYAHLITTTVSVGDVVVQGQQLGLCGSTGTSTNPHLHFALYPVSNGVEQHAVPPEPMSGHTNFTENLSYPSDNVPSGLALVGYQSGNLETGFVRDADGISAKFAEAHRLAAIQRSQLKLVPTQDLGNPQGIFVHAWNGAQGIFVQNFDDLDLEKRGAILWREASSQAHAVRAGFWDQYRFNFGPTDYGAPVTDEGCWTDSNGNRYDAAQQFEQALLLWDRVRTGSSIEVRRGSQMPQGIIAVSDCSATVTAQAFTGGSENHLVLTASSVAYNQIVLSIQDATGVSYDYYRLFKDGLDLGPYPYGTATITDNAVGPVTTYAYQIKGGYNSWGIVSVSEAITLTTPPNPNVFELRVAALAPRETYLWIDDTLFIAPIHAVYRNGQLIGRVAGNEFADFDVVPETSYWYQVQALTASNLSLGSTNVVTVTTPAEPDPVTPPPPPPPQNPTIPLRVMDGITILDPPPYLINTYVTVNFTIENVGSSTVNLGRVRALAVIDLGFQVVTRNFPADEFLTPLALAPGERYTYQRNNANDMFPGVYGNGYVKPLVKLDGIVGEWDVTDVAAGEPGWVAFELLTSNRNPDLVVSAVELVPPAPIGGGTVTLQCTVKNQGDALSPTPYLEITKADGTTETQLLPQVNQGEAVTAQFNLGIHAAGFYNLSYRLDPNNYINEWNEKNNTGSFYYGVRPALADLIVESAALQQLNPDSEDFLILLVTARNVGEIESRWVRIELQAGGLIRDAALFPPLWPGQAAQLYLDLGLLPAGTNGYAVTVDVLGALDELVETNNTLNGSVSVLPEVPIVLTVAKDVAANAVSLSWNNTGAPLYRVIRSLGPTPYEMESGQWFDQAGQQFSDSGRLNDGATYFYLVAHAP